MSRIAAEMTYPVFWRDMKGEQPLQENVVVSVPIYPFFPIVGNAVQEAADFTPLPITVREKISLDLRSRFCHLFWVEIG